MPHFRLLGTLFTVQLSLHRSAVSFLFHLKKLCRSAKFTNAMFPCGKRMYTISTVKNASSDSIAYFGTGAEVSLTWWPWVPKLPRQGGNFGTST